MKNKDKILEDARKSGEQWIAAFRPDGNPDKETILSELSNRTFEGEKVYAVVVDDLGEVKSAVEAALQKLEGPLTKSKVKNRMRELKPWECIWDYYLMAFYGIAYEQCPNQNHEFGSQSFFKAFEAGLGHVINLGPVIIGVTLPEAHRDENNMLHKADGPALIRKNDKQYWWHGVKVQKDWIEDTDNVDPSQALTWENIEERRALCEIIGWDKVIAAIPHKILDTDDDPQIGTLLEADLPDHGKQRFLRVLEGSTGRQFCILVPDYVDTALDAQSEINQIPKDLFKLGFIRS